MILTDRLGYAKYLFNVGKEYGDLVRGSVTGGAMLTFVANYLGVGPVGAVLIGVSLVPVTVAIAVGAGYGIVRWRVIHATIEREWANNPYERAHIDTLREIRDAVTGRCPACGWYYFLDGTGQRIMGHPCGTRAA